MIPLRGAVRPSCLNPVDNQVANYVSGNAQQTESRCRRVGQTRKNLLWVARQHDHSVFLDARNLRCLSRPSTTTWPPNMCAALAVSDGLLQSDGRRGSFNCCCVIW